MKKQSLIYDISIMCIYGHLPDPLASEATGCSGRWARGRAFRPAAGFDWLSTTGWRNGRRGRCWPVRRRHWTGHDSPARERQVRPTAETHERRRGPWAE